jgi:quercetin dioxygenase-like cupin family protein
MKELLISTSAYFSHKMSVLEMDVAPNTGNPKHYHTLFEETFEILEGKLFIGMDKMTTILRQGESITIPIGSVHFFKNKTEHNCRIKITLNPGNTDFEDAMNIYYGLKKEGQISASGIPKKLSDLALFIKLNNSKMPGLGILAGGLLNFIANRSIKNGRLETLRNRYTY